VPLTADSTLAEWLADPRGADLLAQTFAAATDSAVGRMFANPTMLELLGSAPLNRMAAFPGSPLTPEVLEKLTAAAT